MLKNADWSNIDNKSFYEELPIARFQEYAKKGGFDDCCDIEAIADYLEPAKSILEVGAGYGRVVRHLADKFTNKEIYAIERSAKLCSYMQDNIGDLATICHADLNTFSTEQKFGAILWMWSNISDFAKAEHIPILNKISSWLEPNGKLFMDILLDDFQHKGVNIENSPTKNYELSDLGLTVYGYSPTIDEIRGYIKNINLTIIDEIDLLTKTKRNRKIFVCSR